MLRGLAKRTERIRLVVPLKSRAYNVDAGTIRNRTFPKANHNDGLPIKLEYDPTNTKNSFVDLGILPFFQQKLNNFLLKNVNSNTVDNVLPTRDQRSILATLNSNHSLIFRGSSGSGKSLSIMLFALQVALSKIPRFGALENRATSIDSVIVVATDELIKRYHYYVKNLALGLPVNCCPHKLKYQTDNDQQNYEVVRRPLLVEFAFSDGKSLQISSGPQSNNIPPQVLVTTPDRLEKMIFENEKSFSQQFTDCKFLAVDDFDIQLSSSQIHDAKTISVVGEKKKYITKIERCTKEIQNLHFDTFSADLLKRLKDTERRFFNGNFDQKKAIEDKAGKNSSPSGSGFDHASFVYLQEKLNPQLIDRKVIPQYKNKSIEETPNLSLLKLLVKEKKKHFYKQIQFCFITQPEPPYHRLAYQLSLQKHESPIYESIYRQTEQIRSNVDSKIRRDLTKYIIEKSANKINADYQTSIIEKMIRFKDSQWLFTNQERRLLSIGSYNLMSSIKGDFDPSKIEKISLSFVEALIDKNTVDLVNFDVTKFSPEKIDSLNLMKKIVEVNGLKNLEKKSLKTRLSYYKLLLKAGDTRKLESNSLSQIISKGIKAFRQNQNNKPILIVLPPSFELLDLCKSLEASTKEKFSTLSTTELEAFFQKQTTGANPCNIIIHPHQLVGQDFKDMSNLFITGLECLIPQLAFVPITSKSIDNIISDVSGVKNPQMDLFNLYINKVLSFSSAGTKKNMVVFLNNYKIAGQANPMMKEDLEKVTRLMLFNDLNDIVNIKPLLRLPKTHFLNY